MLKVTKFILVNPLYVDPPYLHSPRFEDIKSDSHRLMTYPAFTESIRV